MFTYHAKWTKYLIAIVAVAVAFVTRYLLKSVLGDVAPLLLFTLSVMVAAWCGGLGPGILATMVSAVVGDYFFIKPIHSFHITLNNRVDQIELAIFLIIGVSISLLNQARLTSEAKRQQHLISEQDARKMAETANRLKDDFLTTVSHELRTPMNAILGWASLLRKGKLDQPKTERALEIIEQNAKMQARLIEDLLDESRIVSGTLRLTFEPVKLRQVIEAALDVIRPAAAAKGVQLQLALDPAADYVNGDPTRLQQVVWNLLANAVKFTPKGGLVQIRLDRVDSEAQITVSDTGSGISSQFLPYVFERFRQADSRSGGIGLGLALTRYLVEMHGGAIEVSSAGIGQGATFKVCLPIAVTDPEPSSSLGDWGPKLTVNPHSSA